MDTTYIETERLILRSWRVTDRAVFAEIHSNNKVMKYFPKPLSIEESNGFVDRINSEFEETGFGLYAVEIKETGEFIVSLLNHKEYSLWESLSSIHVM